MLAVVILLVLAGPAVALYRHGDDRRHVDATLSALNRHPPTVPVVYLLGGSAARECITTEARWGAQIAALGGDRVRALDFGSSSQSYQKSLAIVRAAPDVPSLVLIGVNVGRYTTIPPVTALGVAASRLFTRGAAVHEADATLLGPWLHEANATLLPPGAHEAETAPSPRRAAAYDPHRFHNGDQLSDVAKRGIVTQWVRTKYPRFKERYPGNAATLRKLIALCRERGFRPVLVELPLNLPIVRHAWDAARNRYRRGVQAAAKSFGIPYVDFVADIRLVSRDFVDVSHLVESGRAKYQRRLSHLVVVRLKQYGLIQ